MSNHTPRPWKLDPDPITYNADKAKSIGLLCAELKSKGEHEAAECIDRLAERNAELSDALEYLLMRLERVRVESTEDVRIAQDAIAKAKGETENDD